MLLSRSAPSIFGPARARVRFGRLVLTRAGVRQTDRENVLARNVLLATTPDERQRAHKSCTNAPE